jgi:tetratricopeptide (TPR) repeat protein
MAVARFVGVGVGEYDNGHPRLEHAIPDVEAVADLLEASFECTVLRDPGEGAARDYLKALRGSLPEGGGSLVLLWSGHAVRSPVDGLRLLARDSGDYDDDGLGAGGDVAAPCAQSGASQLLLIVDTCFSGEAVTAGELAARIMQRSPPEGEHVWVGVLTSCLPEEVARDGLFARRLARLLERGPEPGPGTRALLVQRWSPQSEYIRGDDLCDAILKTWGTSAHTPDFLSHGSAWSMFRNPRYDPGAPERVVEHLLLAARGGAAPGEHSWFTGRAAEVDQVVGWVRSGRPGLHVITGSAGTGKTAVAGRVVSLSNPAERDRLLAERRAIGHADPGGRSVAAHVHARGLTADRAADLIASQLVRAGVLAAQPDRRNAAELVGQVQRAAEDGAAAPVIVVDGLDEARGQAFTIAEELLLRLAPYATVIVSTRELRRGQTEPSLLDVLTAGVAELDLDDPAAQQRGRGDMRAYIARRLAGVDPAMDPDAVAGHLAGETSMTGGSPFLLARLVTDQLRASPVDTSRPGWQDQVSHSIEYAFDADLAQAHAAGESARTLLTALTWGFGAGLPEEEWLACANALGDGELGRDDVTAVLDQVGRYIIQDGEAGAAVYRIAHQTLADHIRPPFAATHQQVFDPQAQPVAAELLGRYAELLASGVPVTGPGYLWRYAWRHAAAAGPAGLELIRGLAAGESKLLPDVAIADQEVANRLASWGYRLEAVTPAEEAVRLRRELADANPAFLPDLAAALNNLGNRYSEVGRRHDALAPGEEAVRLYRELADANPAFLPDLAMALTNLGNHYSEAGSSDRVETAWEHTITEAAPQAAAYLLIARAAAADAGHPAAAAWLGRALALELEDRGLVNAAHEQARRHRGPSPAVFDQDWALRTGMPVPAWLTVDSALLSSAQAWVATDTYTAERDHLAAHPELLEGAADTAVAEALLAVPEDEAGRYTALRQAAEHEGADVAYRPLLLTILAREFADADPARQRALLADCADDLLTGTVTDTLNELAGQEDQQAVAAQRATALLDLARTGDAEPVLEAVTEPGRFPRLLHELAIRTGAASAGPAAVVAYTAATTPAEAASAVFYLAVAAAAGGDQEQAGDLIRQARAADPAQVPAWINELAEIGQHHQGVLQLIPELTAPDPPAPPGPPPEDTR